MGKGKASTKNSAAKLTSAEKKERAKAKAAKLAAAKARAQESRKARFNLGFNGYANAYSFRRTWEPVQGAWEYTQLTEQEVEDMKTGKHDHVKESSIVAKQVELAYQAWLASLKEMPEDSYQLRKEWEVEWKRQKEAEGEPNYVEYAGKEAERLHAEEEDCRRAQQQEEEMQRVG